jgi:MFS family permease
MLLMVFTLVEAPSVGWGTARTLGSFAAALAILAGFDFHERRSPAPLIRLGILRSGSLVRANLGAMSLFGGWVGFQFIVTLYMQQLRGWSPLHTGLAIFPAGVLVAVIAPRLAPLIERFGVARLTLVGLSAMVGAYLLFLPIGLNSGYASAMLPTFLLGGLGFGLAYGPLNIAATNGIAPEEQGLAGGLLNTSFQFGGALVLAVVTATDNAGTGAAHTPEALLHGFQNAIVVSVIAAALGVVAFAALRRRTLTGGRQVLRAPGRLFRPPPGRSWWLPSTPDASAALALDVVEIESTEVDAAEDACVC